MMITVTESVAGQGQAGRSAGAASPSQSPSQSPSPSQQMLKLLNSFLTVQALHVAAVLGIADHLANGVRSVEDLASISGTDTEALYRLLRMLADAGVFNEDQQAERQFSLTPLGATLASEGPESVRDWALFVGAPATWQVWGQLHDSVMTGQPAFPRVHGMALWDYLAGHPELGAPFDRWMSRQSQQHNAALLASYDFSPFGTVADIGGGQGATLAGILHACPALRGVLFDLPHVVANPTPLQHAGLADRCEVRAGDMLDGVPPGADAYLLKRVLMDTSDPHAVRVLSRCAAAMAPGGRVLVVEMVLPPAGTPSVGKTFDLLMLLMHAGGRVRTEAEFRELFQAAGLRLARTIPTPSPNSILEGVRTT